MSCMVLSWFLDSLSVLATSLTVTFSRPMFLSMSRTISLVLMSLIMSSPRLSSSTAASSSSASRGN